MHNQFYLFSLFSWKYQTILPMMMIQGTPLNLILFNQKDGLGVIQYLRKKVEVGGWLVNCLQL